MNRQKLRALGYQYLLNDNTPALIIILIAMGERYEKGMLIHRVA